MTKFGKNKQKNNIAACNAKDVPAEAERKVEEESSSQASASTDSAWNFLGIKKEEAIAELQMIKDEEWEKILPISCRLLQGMIDFFARNQVPEGTQDKEQEKSKTQPSDTTHGLDSLTDNPNTDSADNSSAPSEKEGQNKSDDDGGNSSSDEAVSQADTKSNPDIENAITLASTSGSSCSSSSTSSVSRKPGQSESESAPSDAPHVKASLKIRIPVEQFPGVSSAAHVSYNPA
jgi:hypothetical protein